MKKFAGLVLVLILAGCAVTDGPNGSTVVKISPSSIFKEGAGQSANAKTVTKEQLSDAQKIYGGPNIFSLSPVAVYPGIQPLYFDGLMYRECAKKYLFSAKSGRPVPERDVQRCATEYRLIQYALQQASKPFDAKVIPKKISADSADDLALKQVWGQLSNELLSKLRAASYFTYDLKSKPDEQAAIKGKLQLRFAFEDFSRQDEVILFSPQYVQPNMNSVDVIEFDKVRRSGKLQWYMTCAVKLEYKNYAERKTRKNIDDPLRDINFTVTQYTCKDSAGKVRF
jgi:hypothetical protein